MKKNIRSYLFILTVFFAFPTLLGEQLIILFLKPYPVISEQEASQKLAQKLHKPGKIANHLSKHILSAQVSGIFATYGGLLTASNLMGELSFPRLHNKSFIYLLVTEHITPIVMTGNTIHHWEIEDDAVADLYKIEQKFDQENKVHYWEVSREPIPDNRHVPLESITLLANPKYVYVPLGISIYQESPHLILPDVYIKKGIHLTSNYLYFINLLQYFGAIRPLYKKDKTLFLRQLTY